MDLWAELIVKFLYTFLFDSSALSRFFFSEPGYYEDNEFGIRIESLLLVKETSATVMCFLFLFHNFELVICYIVFTMKLDVRNCFKWLLTWWFVSFNFSPASQCFSSKTD